MKEVLGMKWYKFLIYFALFAAALVDLVTAVLSIVDIVKLVQLTDLTADRRVAGALAVTIIVCIILVALAALLIVTRFRLAKFKHDGPILLIAIYLADFIIGLFYCITVSYILGKSMFGVYQIIILIVQAVMAQINFIYFDNRADLFRKNKVEVEKV